MEYLLKNKNMKKEQVPFAGDKKEGSWFLKRAEERLRDGLVPLVPRWMETYHLTMLTLVWSLLIIVFGFLARYNIHFLWGISFLIFLQYITDLLDGAIGRARNTGLIKWGYYMDHLLDYFFLCSVLMSYGFLLPDYYKFMMFFLQAVIAGFMIHTFLSFATKNAFTISYFGIGPTEMRILFILLNIFIIFFGIDSIIVGIPYVLGISIFALAVIVTKTQKEIWDLDMSFKKK